MGEIRHF